VRHERRPSLADGTLGSYERPLFTMTEHSKMPGAAEPSIYAARSATARLAAQLVQIVWSHSTEAGIPALAWLLREMLDSLDGSHRPENPPGRVGDVVSELRMECAQIPRERCAAALVAAEVECARLLWAGRLQ